jgi:hypothetical protein
MTAAGPNLLRPAHPAPRRTTVRFSRSSQTVLTTLSVKSVLAPYAIAMVPTPSDSISDFNAVSVSMLQALAIRSITWSAAQVWLKPGETVFTRMPLGASQPNAATIAELQSQLDIFVEIYNHSRPHRSMHHQATPANVYTARPKADPATPTNTHDRVRHDTIDQFGKLTLRHAGRLHHIGVGRTHAHTHIVMLIQDLNVRIINAATGELIRQLLDPTRDYQPRNAPTGRPKENPEP